MWLVVFAIIMYSKVIRYKKHYTEYNHARGSHVTQQLVGRKREEGYTGPPALAGAAAAAAAAA